MEKFIKSVKGRRYLYRILIAGIALAVTYGLIDGDAAQEWIMLVAAGLGLVVADGNATNAGAEPEESEDDETV